MLTKYYAFINPSFQQSAISFSRRMIKTGNLLTLQPGGYFTHQPSARQDALYPERGLLVPYFPGGAELFFTAASSDLRFIVGPASKKNGLPAPRILLRPRVARARGSSHPPIPHFIILLELQHPFHRHDTLPTHLHGLNDVVIRLDLYENLRMDARSHSPARRGFPSLGHVDHAFCTR